MPVGQEHKKRIKERKKETKNSINSGPIIAGLVVIAIGMLIVRLFFGVQAHFKRYVYYTQSIMPCSFQSPLARRLHTEMETLSPSAEDNWVNMTEEELLNSAKNSLILRVIYVLESTEGKNDGCKEYGTINGLGYAQHSEEFRCYDTFARVVRDADQWFVERMAENGNKLAEALCYYNTGTPGLHTCEYSQNFLNALGSKL